MKRFVIAAALAMIFACRVSQDPVTAPVKTGESAVKGAPPTGCENPKTPADWYFPAGYDYPQSQETVTGWSGRSGNGQRERLHAYCLFAGLNQPVQVQGQTMPLWQSWKTSTQAFPNQYNPWKPTGPDGKPLEGTDAPRPVTINEVRNRALGTPAISNPAPIYPVNQAIVTNPRYSQCLQPLIVDNLILGFSLKDGEVFQSNGDIMIAAVSYNPPALSEILGSSFYNADTLDGKLPKPGDASTSISMPDGSIVLKVMLWPVAGNNATGDNATALPVWDWDTHKPGSPADGQYAGYEMKEFWTQAVAVSPRQQVPAGQTKTVRFLYGVFYPNRAMMLPNQYDGAPVVGLDRFYSKTYAKSDLDSLSACDRALLDASAYWTYNRAFQAGDSLALVAMHMMTKEQPGWTFQSAWWHPGARDCPGGRDTQYRLCSRGRPTPVPGSDTTWTNYMMVTTYGMTQDTSKPNSYRPPDADPSNLWPVAYNPYIELAASHPITTNCRNCHHRAAWPPDDPVNKADRGRSSAYLQASPTHPDVLEKFDSGNPIFNGLLLVDSMWAISDRAGYPRSGTETAKKESGQ